MISLIPTTARKLLKMPRQEIATRVRGKLRQVRERRMAASGGCMAAVDRAVSQQLAQRARQLVPGSGFHAAVRKRVDAMSQGRLELLGRQIAFPKAGGIDWHRDPLSKFRWPEKFYADVPIYELPGDVDVKYVWELARHQWMVDLALDWKASTNAWAAERVRFLLLDWIEQNPEHQGVHWTSGLELSMRVTSWVHALSLTSDWSGWRPDDFTRIATSIAQHAEYLTHHPSLYSSPYNHLIGEATGLYLCGLWLSGMNHEDDCRDDRADAWKQRGAGWLLKHTERQFHPDGFGVEQATGYHFFTLGFLLQAMAWSDRDDQRLNPLRPVVNRAFRAGVAFQQPDGTWPMIGDVDSARSIPVMPDHFSDFTGVCRLAAAKFNDPALLPRDEPPGNINLSNQLEVGLLLGEEGLQQLACMSPDRQPGQVMLPHSGYVIAATTPRDQSAGAGGDWMLFDCGPIAGGLHGDGTPSVGHGHADLLQLLLFQNGKPVLIDSGMPRYAGSRQWVDHFRDAAAHNTISLSGASACQHAGRLAWKQVDFRHEIQHALHNGVCLARGRVSLRSGDLIERTVIHLPGLATWVVDWLRVTTKRIATWNWHQPVDCESAITMWDQSGAVKLAPTKLRPEDPAGWIAPGYGQLVPGKRLSFSREVARKVLVATCIAPVPLDARLKYGEQTLVCQSAWNSISATEPKHVSFHRLTAELFVPATAPAPVLNTTMAEAPAPTT